MFFNRSEQDKEPEQEAVSEVVGPGPKEESAADSKYSTLEFLLFFSKWVELCNLSFISGAQLFSILCFSPDRQLVYSYLHTTGLHITSHMLTLINILLVSSTGNRRVRTC